MLEYLALSSLEVEIIIDSMLNVIWWKIERDQGEAAQNDVSVTER